MPKVFGFTTRHGYRCVDVELYDMCSTESIYWSDRKNSYVLTKDEDKDAIPRGKLTLPDGTHVRLLSVNGIGEVRWEAMNWQLSSILERTPGPGSDAHEIHAAAHHFGLSYDGKRL